jgi:hypothetical protein
MKTKTDLQDRELPREKPGPKPRLGVKLFQVHYRLSQDMRQLLTELRGPLHCTTDQDVLDQCLMFAGQRFKPKVYRRRWMGKT